MPYSLVITIPCCYDLTIPCSYDITMPYSYNIRIGIIVYTLYYIFFNFTATSVTFGVKDLIYRMLGGDRRGGRRVTEVTVNAEKQ